MVPIGGGGLGPQPPQLTVNTRAPATSACGTSPRIRPPELRCMTLLKRGPRRCYHTIDRLSSLYRTFAFGQARYDENTVPVYGNGYQPGPHLKWNCTPSSPPDPRAFMVPSHDSPIGCEGSATQFVSHWPVIVPLRPFHVTSAVNGPEAVR